MESVNTFVFHFHETTKQVRKLYGWYQGEREKQGKNNEKKIYATTDISTGLQNH